MIYQPGWSNLVQGVIAPMITHIVNIMSIRQGIIPDDLKSTRVIPFHKKGRRNDATVYITIIIHNNLYFKSHG